MMTDLSNYVSIERITPNKDHYFFGYYDISPESPDGSRILANKISFIDREPRLGDELELGYFRPGEVTFNKISSSTAWNFQEGCRLQWLSNDLVIFNSRNSDCLCSIVYNVVSNKVVKILSLPIYSVCKESNIATSYGFFNNKYNYPHTNEESVNDPYGDGIYIIDLSSGSYKKIVYLNQLMDIAKSHNFHNWIEYCVFNPGGDRIYFFHRWENDKSLLGNQLCECDLNGNVKILLNSKFVSHAGWRGNNQITSWCRIPSAINSVQNNRFLARTGVFQSIKYLYHFFVKKPSLRQFFTNDSYVLFDIEKSFQRKISNPLLISDGHCSWSNNGKYMLTDTYPDEKDNRTLLILDYLENTVFILGKFYSFPNKMKQSIPNWNISRLRCDLHPKWSFDNKYVYFDSVHEGFRGLYRIDISNFIKGN